MNISNNNIPIRFLSGREYDLNLDHLIKEEPKEELELLSYDIYLLAFSGGKDSLAALLELIEQGVPRHKIECHHHLVDGKGEEFMDWPCTEEYCKAVCDSLGVKFYLSWKEGGFLKEMQRCNEPTSAILFETPEGDIKKVGGNSKKLGTRLQFPALSSNLAIRWCSSYMKIDVANRLICHQKRFEGKRTLVITGERAAEGGRRSSYSEFLPHASSVTKKPKLDAKGDKVKSPNGDVVYDLKRNKKRFIDHYRIVHKWSEKQIWSIIERYSILPHPAYILSWGRTSCLTCIFASPNQWATIKVYMPERFDKIVRAEKANGKTIHFKRNSSGEVVQVPLAEIAAQGTPYDIDEYWLEIAMSSGRFVHSVIIDDWFLPNGAYGEQNGPT